MSDAALNALNDALDLPMPGALMSPTEVAEEAVPEDESSEVADESPQQVEEPSVAEPVAEVVAAPKKVPEENQRFQKLANENRELKEYMARLEQRIAQATQQRPQATPEMAELVSLMARQEQQRAAEAARNEEANLPEHEKIRRDFQRKIEDNLRAQMQPEFARVNSEVSQLRAERDAARQAAQQAATVYQAKKHVSQLVKKEFGAAASDKFVDQIFTYSAAFGVSPEEAAAQLKSSMLEFHKQQLAQSTRKAPAKTTPAQSPRIPQALGGSAAKVEQYQAPTNAQLAEAGVSRLGWFSRGFHKKVK